MAHWGITRYDERLGLQYFAGDGAALPGLGSVMHWSSDPNDAVDYGTQKDARLVLREGFGTRSGLSVTRLPNREATDG